MQHTQGKLIVSKGVGLRAPPKQVTYVAKKKYAKYPKIKQEWKAITTAVSMTSDATGSLQLLNGCQTGNDIANREGREINLRTFETKLSCIATAGTGTNQTQRILLVLDKACNGSAPAIANILDAATTTSLRNLNYRKRFKILMDKRYTLQKEEVGQNRMAFKKYKPLRIVTQFNAGNAGDISDITTGSLYLVSIGSNVAGETAGTVTGSARIRFTE